MPNSINRALLGTAGFRLREAEYIQAVAYLGAKTTPSEDTINELSFSLRWECSQFVQKRDRYSDNPEILRNASGLWTEQKKLTKGNLLIDTQYVPPNSPDLIEIARILSQPAAALASVAIDYSSSYTDEKWQWPLRVAAFPDDFAELQIKTLGTSLPALIEAHELSRERPRADLLVVHADLRNTLQRILGLPYPIRAGYCILFAPADVTWKNLRPYVDTLLAETQAGGVSLVYLPPKRRAVDALKDLIEKKLSHNTPFDLALGLAFPRESSVHILNPALIRRAALPIALERIAPRLLRLPADVRFTLRPARLNVGLRWEAGRPLSDLVDELKGATFPFARESQGATAISRIAAAERDARRSAARHEKPRYLQGEVSRVDEQAPVKELRSFAVGRTYQLDMFIGESGLAPLQLEGPFPSDQLDWTLDSHTLQVLFTEPEQLTEPMRGILKLPRLGRSTTCTFVFAPRNRGVFAGRIAVLHRGRVLQTAVLSGEVLSAVDENEKSTDLGPIKFQEEAIVRRNLGTLDDRRWFDASLVLNHSSARKVAMTAAGMDGAYIATLDGLKPQLKAINDLLNAVAHDQKRYHGGLTSKANAELLVALATEGNWLYRNLVLAYIDISSAGRAIRDGEYLQIVSTQPDALVPLEFVYDYAPPKDGAPVCPNAVQALKDGYCLARCVPNDSPASHVCPLGFWGLRKVIERHLHVGALDKPAVAKVVSEPAVGHDLLKLEGHALLATSSQVDEEPVKSGKRGKTPRKKPSKKLQEDMAATWQQTVNTVLKWDQWKQVVQATPPVLIVALPHADGTDAKISLEISGDVIESRFIDTKYVQPDSTKPAPVVLLLGCDVANVAHTDAYARHIAVFREANAALVLGTVATIFGKDAAEMTGRLVDHLVKTVKSKPSRFGEVLRQAKRDAVADSLMIALCLVAFGDADWRLEL